MTKWRLGAALAMSAALLAACSDDDEEPTLPDPGTASVRVVHAAGAAPGGLDVDVDGVSGTSNVQFGTAAARFDVEEGERTFSAISPAGAAPVTLFDTTTTLAEDETISFLIIGEDAAFSSLILDDDATPPTAGMVRTRIVHASPAAGDVDVYITEPDADLATEVAVLEAAAYGDVATPTEMAAGSYQIRIVATGTTDVILDLGTVDFTADGIQTLVVTDSQTGAVDPVHGFILADS